LQLILDEEEVKIKTAMWMRQNADFLKEMKGIYLQYILTLPIKYGSILQLRRHNELLFVAL